MSADQLDRAACNGLEAVADLVELLGRDRRRGASTCIDTWIDIWIDRDRDVEQRRKSLRHRTGTVHHTTSLSEHVARTAIYRDRP